MLREYLDPAYDMQDEEVEMRLIGNRKLAVKRRSNLGSYPELDKTPIPRFASVDEIPAEAV